MKNAIAIAILILLSFANPPPLWAQGSNKAAAEALYQQGVDLYKADKFEQAAEKLDASQKLDPAIGTLLYLGAAYEKLDRKASAWATFKEAASLAQRRKDDRQKTAEVRAAALLPQVSHLVVRVPTPTARLAGFTLRRDGVEMPSASFGVPLPVDAGTLELTANASAHQPWMTTVTIPGGGKEITVDVPSLKTSAAAPQPPDAIPTPLPPPDPRPDQATGGGLGTTLLISGIAVGVLGLAGVATGSAFGLMARDSRDASLTRCRTEQFCTPEGVSLREDAQGQATLSTVAFIIGGVFVAGGVTLVVLSQTLEDEDPDPNATLQRLELTPMAGPAQAGLTMRGIW